MDLFLQLMSNPTFAHVCAYLTLGAIVGGSVASGVEPYLASFPRLRVGAHVIASIGLDVRKLVAAKVLPEAGAK